MKPMKPETIACERCDSLGYEDAGSEYIGVCRHCDGTHFRPEKLADVLADRATLRRTLARECRARQAAEIRYQRVKQAWERDMAKGREAFAERDAAREERDELRLHAIAAHKVLDDAGAPHASDQHAIAYRIERLIERYEADQRPAAAVVLNPEAVGDPAKSLVVQLSPATAAALRKIQKGGGS